LPDEQPGVITESQDHANYQNQNLFLKSSQIVFILASAKCGSHYSAIGGASFVWIALFCRRRRHSRVVRTQVRGFTPDRDTSCGSQVEGTPTPSLNKHNPHLINKATVRIIAF